MFTDGDGLHLFTKMESPFAPKKLITLISIKNRSPTASWLLSNMENGGGF
jgi:hypothetical protein